MSIYDEIRVERERQDRRWGGPTHDDQHSVHDWVDFINRQLDLVFKSLAPPRPPTRDRLIKIAALAVAAVESLDRKNNDLAAKETP